MSSGAGRVNKLAGPINPISIRPHISPLQIGGEQFTRMGCIRDQAHPRLECCENIIEELKRTDPQVAGSTLIDR